MFAEVHLQTRYDLKEKLCSKTTQGSAKNMVSKHRWSHNTGTIYLECIALVIEKDGLSTQVVFQAGLTVYASSLGLGQCEFNAILKNI